MLSNLAKSIIGKGISTNRQYFSKAQLPKFALKQEKIVNSTDSLLSQTFDSIQINSNEDWKKLRKEILDNVSAYSTINAHNIDTILVSYCASIKKYDLAKKYIDFLKTENVEVKLGTLGKYLRGLYIKFVNEEGKVDEREIFAICDEIQKKYPVLDSISLENMLMALSITKRWESCTQYLKEIKLTANPSHAAYSASAAAAFRNKKYEMGWKIIDEMFENDRLPLNVVYLAYLNTLRNIKKKETFLKMLEDIFQFMQNHNIICNEEVVTNVANLTNQHLLSNKTTRINKFGQCKNCESQLKAFELTDNEFGELKKSIMSNVILGKDIFIKTSPEELQRFNEFVKQMPRFDVVLDGLNVAFSAGTKQNANVFAALVAAVVKHFVDQNMSVLVLGRSHMNKWSQKYWGYVVANATIFLTQNISQDDPYLLYCALNSGKNTRIITRDLMRSHKFLLKDMRLKMLFNRWLEQRQYQLIRVNGKGVPIFKNPLPYSCIPQKNGNFWHIPFRATSMNIEDNQNLPWLCIQC